MSGVSSLSPEGAMVQRFPMRIDGRDHPPDSGEWFETEDPFRGAAWAEVARGSHVDVETAVTAAHRAFTGGPWATLSHTARGQLLNRIADAIAANVDALAGLEVRENGKLLAEMRGQVAYL